MSEQDWKQMEADEKAMGDTPRTDGCARENARFCADTGLAAALALSRQLERESDALRRELEEAKARAEHYVSLFHEYYQLSRPSVHSNPSLAIKLAIQNGSKFNEINRLRGTHDCGCEICSTSSAMCPATASSYALAIIEARDQLAAAQKEIERQKARITALRSGLLLIAGSGCEGEDPEQLCKEFELQMTSFCIPCKAAYFLELDDKPPAIAQAKGAE